MIVHTCDRCGAQYTDDSLPKEQHEVRALHLRVDPGGVMPSGECHCGALTYEEEQ